VARSPDRAVTGACAFLRHGAGLNLWQSFLTKLEQLAAQLSDDVTATNGACRAFAIFEAAASRTSNPRTVVC
jgi:heme oxygenase